MFSWFKRNKAEENTYKQDEVVPKCSTSSIDVETRRRCVNYGEDKIEHMLLVNLPDGGFVLTFNSPAELVGLRDIINKHISKVSVLEESTTEGVIHTDILDRYDGMLKKHIEADTPVQFVIGSATTSFTHLRWMLGEIRKMTDVGKANRWLGYIQGVLIFNHFTTLDIEREFMRPYFKGENS